MPASPSSASATAVTLAVLTWMVVHDGVAQMLHDAYLENVPHPLEIDVEDRERGHDERAQEFVDVHARDEGDCASTAGVEAEEGPLHALDEVVNARQAVGLPLQLPLGPFGPPAASLTWGQRKDSQGGPDLRKGMHWRRRRKICCSSGMLSLEGSRMERA